MELQNRHLIASAWIVSRQNGHGFVAAAANGARQLGQKRAPSSAANPQLEHVGITSSVNEIEKPYHRPLREVFELTSRLRAKLRRLVPARDGELAPEALSASDAPAARREIEGCAWLSARRRGQPRARPNGNSPQPQRQPAPNSSGNLAQPDIQGGLARTPGGDPVPREDSRRARCRVRRSPATHSRRQGRDDSVAARQLFELARNVGVLTPGQEVPPPRGTPAPRVDCPSALSCGTLLTAATRGRLASCTGHHLCCAVQPGVAR
jgi:hypothetical protein